MILPKAHRQRRERIAAYRQRLSWSQTAIALGEQAAPMQAVFLEEVMAAELANREVGRQARLLSRAGFPAHKTLADCDRCVAQRPRTLTGEARAGRLHWRPPACRVLRRRRLRNDPSEHGTRTGGV